MNKFEVFQWVINMGTMHLLSFGKAFMFRYKYLK